LRARTLTSTKILLQNSIEITTSLPSGGHLRGVQQRQRFAALFQFSWPGVVFRGFE
jgi:hypothetical protein